MRKDIIQFLGVIFFIIILGFVLWFWSARSEKIEQNQPATPITSSTILFYGEECPHCKDVEKFIEENKIAEKVKFDSLEVWYNKKNNQLLMEKTRECSIEKNEIGVPFLYSEGKCLIGAPDIEKFFKEKAGI